jgi:hypothetical protein
MPKIVQNPAKCLDEPRFSISGGHPFSYGSGYAISASGHHWLDEPRPAPVWIDPGRPVVKPMSPPVKMADVDVTPVPPEPTPPPKPAPPANNHDFEDFVNTAKRAGF